MQEEFADYETLCTEDGNGWRPDDSMPEKVDAQKGMTLCADSLPSALTIFLGRSSFASDQGAQKICSRFEFPVVSKCSTLYLS